MDVKIETTAERGVELTEKLWAAIATVRDAPTDEIIEAILPIIREHMATAFGEYADNMEGVRLGRVDEIENMRSVAQSIRDGLYL